MCGEGAATEHVTGGLRSFVLEVSRWMGKPFGVDSDQIETFTENNQHYTTWDIANILKIPKSIKLLVKIKICILFYEKTYMDF